MAVSFQNADTSFRLPCKAALKKFITTSFEAEAKKKLSLAYICCTDAYLLRINQDFLQHDFYTDIITFPLSETDHRVEAEIYISIDRIRENALTHRVPFEQELYRVIFHGVLHLIGFKDKTTAQKNAMRQAEDRWISAFALSLQLRFKSLMQH
jgi:probable rRNA maturation factor